MASSLILLDEYSASSDTEVILGGGSSGSSGANVSIDNTYNVYLVTLDNLDGSSDPFTVRMRYFRAGSEENSAFYDYGHTLLDSAAAYAAGSVRLSSYQPIHQSAGSSGGEKMTGSIFYFNLGNSSVDCSHTLQLSNHDSAGRYHGFIGGGTYRQLIAVDGIKFYVTSGTMDSGNFKLYGLKK